MAKSLDLTRFDFHVVRFMESETVDQMSAEEVGQYLLLMCKAWLSGKAASLPNNPDLLAKYARCEKVSPLVLSRWTEGDDGRLYNERLSEEWDAAVARSGKSAEEGRKGGQARSEAKAAAARENGKLGGRPSEKPNETEGAFGGNPSPSRTNAMQTNASQPMPMPVTPAGNRIGTPAGILAGSKQSHSSSNRIPSPDDLDLDFGVSDAERLANLLWDVLPVERQAEAPRGWEKLWATDIETLLETESARSIEAVIRAIPETKWAKFIYRGKNLVENYAAILNDYNKVKARKKS